MSSTLVWDLVADIGGTNARLALALPHGTPGAAESGSVALEHPRMFECRRFSGVEELVFEYLRACGDPPVRRAALAVATAVTADQIQFTNLAWSFSRQALQEAFGWETLLLLNDFTALAMSLPGLQPAELMALPGTETQPPLALGPKALLGAGTGLGMSGLLPDGRGGWVAIAGEGGHATLAPNGSLEGAVAACLQRWFSHVSIERVLSGEGLVNLYNAVCHVNGLHAQLLKPAEVVERGLAGRDAACDQALDCFCSFLGGAAGNWALALGATGGVYIGGGIAPRLMSRLVQGRFRQSFEAKGRLSPLLRRTPTWVLVDQPYPALRGAAAALCQVGADCTHHLAQSL